MSSGGHEIPAHGHDERFETLDAAAVALLEPFVASAAPGELSRAMSTALDAVAAEAVGRAMPAFAGLAGALSQELRSRAPGDSGLAERLEAWAAQAVGFCAGQMAPSEVPAWVDAIADLPGVARLAHDAPWRADLDAECRRLVEARVAAPEQEVTVSSSPPDGPPVPPARVPSEATRDEAGGGEIVLTAEEAILLADDVEDIASQIVALAAAAQQGAVGAGAASTAQSAGDAFSIAERFDYFASAAGHVGLPYLVRQSARFARAFAEGGDALTALRDGDRVLHWVRGCAAWLRAPTPRTCDGLRDAANGLPDVSPAMHELLENMLRAARVATRRPVAASIPLESGAASAADADEIDASVVESMLREVPVLAGRLVASLEAARSGDLEQFAEAGRIAHTLKGAANTAGATAIGALMHLAEDVLEASPVAAGAPDEATLDALIAAADTVADIADATGRGEVLDARAVGDCGAALADRLQVLLGVHGDGGQGEAAHGAQAGFADVPTLDEPLEPADASAAWIAPGPTSVGPSGAEPAASGDEADAGMEAVRIPATIVARLMEAANDSSIVLAQVRARLDAMSGLARAARANGERLQDIAFEYEREGAGVRQSAAPEVGSAAAGDDSGLARRLAESGADARQIEQALDVELTGLNTLLARLERTQSEMRELALAAETMPVGSIAPRLRRAARQAMRMAGRRVRFEIVGETLGFDRGLLQALVEPLGHLIRNAIDHGGEDAERRRDAGKPVDESVRMSFARDGTYLRVRCEDDGAGFDLDRIRERAVARGLLEPDASLPPWDLLQFVFDPGFSTRATASALSGRGIGLDAVRHAVRALGGSVAIVPLAGPGACVEIRVPMLAGTISVMVVRSGLSVLALLVRGVEQVVPEGIDPVTGLAAGQVEVDGVAIPVDALEDLVALPPGTLREDSESGASPVVLVLGESGAAPGAVRVPRLEQAGTVVVRPLPGCIAPIPGIIGAAVLGDGVVAPVLDLAAVRAARSWWSAREAPVAAAPRVEPPGCLVVDDSVSVRRATMAFVEDLGMRAEGAIDGEDALAKVRRQVPALMIVDLEMPRMDGLALVRAIRADPRTAGVPTIMITTRAGAAQRAQAADAGVDAFLAKPFVEEELAARIRECLAAPRRPDSTGL